MGVTVKILVLILAIAGGLVYRNVTQLWADLPAPKLDPQEWWGDEAQPKDYEAYLKNNSEVIGNRLSYPDKVSGGLSVIMYYILTHTMCRPLLI